MSQHVVAVPGIRQRCATVDTAHSGQVGRCPGPDHFCSMRQAAQAAQVEYALGPDLANVLICCEEDWSGRYEPADAITVPAP
jgi:hypothetical protein